MEDSIPKKKKKNNYQYYHNQNKNYYKKRRDGYDNKTNILLSNDYDKQMVIEPIKKSVSNHEIKKTRVFKKSILIYALVFLVVFGLLFGVSYSYFNYTRLDSKHADITTGTLYVRIVEDMANITLNKLYPRHDEEARNRNDNYFDFTIKGKNTSETRSLIYTINIDNGIDISGKTRIDPEHIRVDLQEKVNNEYVYIEDGVDLKNFSFTSLIPVNTNDEITREYRLRMWIGDDVSIGESGATYTQSEFSNLFATFGVSVNSYDRKVAYTMFSKEVDTETQIDFGSISSSTNGKGLYLLSGTAGNNFPIYYYRGAVENNNVIFGGFCWQMVRTTNTGGIKMIYNGVPTGNGKTCENTTHADRIIESDEFNTYRNSVSDGGYMYNQRYVVSSSNWKEDAVFGSNITWDGTNYTLTDATVTIPDATHHYSCNEPDANATCTNLRYVFFVNNTDKYYIVLTGGENIEDALYKMTGNGSHEVKERNHDYILNSIDSKAKEKVEGWFKTNLTNEVDGSKTDYRGYIEDTIYCNDRSYKTVGDTGTFALSGWNPNGTSITGYLYLGANARFNNGYYNTVNVPSTLCPNKTDQFKVSNRKAKLNYPVGLIEVDEVIMAGARGNGSGNNTSYYLYTGDDYWSISNSGFYNDINYSFLVNNEGSVSRDGVATSSGLRPVISLKLGVQFESVGDGTPTNPYVVKYN